MSLYTENKHTVVLLGDSFVGKTCLSRALLSEQIWDLFPGWSGVVYKAFQIGDKTIKLEIFDTQGQQERYWNISQVYVKKSVGIIIVYDVTDRKSYGNVINWIQIARESAQEGAIFGLIANKIDAEERRNVSSAESSKFARDNNLFYYEVSCKDSQSVLECFQNFARLICDAENYVDTKNSNYGRQEACSIS